MGVVLTAAQQIALVRAAGFEVLEHRMVEGCEYNALPRRLERTVRSCLFFIARPSAGESPTIKASSSDPHDEL